MAMAVSVKPTDSGAEALALDAVVFYGEYEQQSPQRGRFM